MTDQENEPQGTQGYYWTPEWQVGEREADEDIRSGRVHSFNTWEGAVECRSMTDDEKILKFAGYKLNWDTYRIEDPDGNAIDGDPDTTDLTWLFKWCVPKLDNWSLNTYDTHVTAIVHRGTDMGTADAPKDRPGEALRAAIVALIESEAAPTTGQ